MSLSNDFKGVWTPKEILELDLPAIEKFLLAIIFNFGESGECFASNTWIADKLGTGVRNVQKMLLKLERAGFLERNNTNNTHTMRVIGVRTTVRRGYEPQYVGVRTVGRRGTNHRTPPYIDVYKKEENKLITPIQLPSVNNDLNFDTETIQEFKTKYPSVDVEDEIETARLWLASTGKKYKNYKAFTHNWLRRKRNSYPVGKIQNTIPTRENTPELTLEEREDIAREKFLRIQNTPGVPA